MCNNNLSCVHINPRRACAARVNVLEQGPDFWCWFDKTKFSYHFVHNAYVQFRLAAR